MARTYRREVSARIRDGYEHVHQLRWQLRLTCLWIAALALVSAHMFLRPGERAATVAVPGVLVLSALLDIAAGPCLRSWQRVRRSRSVVRGN